MSGAVSPERPYGELITTTLRVMTWNVWGRFRPWQEREAALIRTLEAEKDVRLLFTDVGLPGGLNGRQLADEARRRRLVLFTTGYTRNAIIHQGRLDPGAELIGKPFTYATLVAKIQRLLRRAA